MNIAFTTCVQLGKSCIETVYETGGHFDLLITLKDENARNKSGRIYLDDLAQEKNVPLLKINHINDQEVLDAIDQYSIDWLFIIGWSQIAGDAVLNKPTYGCIGMHPTLLPEGRGRASIPWAILKGLDKTGVTMFKLDSGVDTGDIIAQGEIKLSPQITATELYAKVNEMHCWLIKNYWPQIYSGTIQLKKQDNKLATVWPGRKPVDGEITSAMTMKDADRMIRAVTHPYPGAFYYAGEKKIIIWSAKVQKTATENALPLLDGYLLPYEFEVTAREEH